MHFQTSIALSRNMRLTKPFLSVVLLCFFTCLSSLVFSQQNYSITINDIPKQKLLSVGSSSVGIQEGVPAWATEAMADSIYKSLGFNALRLWSNTEQNQTVNDMLSKFDYYVSSGILDAARSRGTQTLLLAPMRYGETPSEPMEEYTEKIAEFLRRAKSERGVVFNATGVANEPGFTVAQMTEAVKLLRKKLDSKGLQNVGIVAPEAASADDRGFSLVQGIKSDPVAWNGLLGIASHSYNMAANKQWENSITGTGKQYWMTEASDNGNETANDDTRAATIAARFLNDMNHLVDNWYYFIGYSSSSDVTSDGDNATKLMVYDFRTGKVFETLKYYYFKQIRAVFDYNAVFRDAVSATEGDMVYTYGQKPAINCAAAKNPDGTWGIGAVNLTGIQAAFFGETYYPAATYNVTIQVKELANVPVASFKLYRSSGTKRFSNDGIVNMINGSVTVQISPKEFISLRQTSSSSSKADQSISFATLSNKNVGDAPFSLSATASSGLPVSFRVVSGPATLTGNTLSVTAAGTVEVEASQAGSSVFNPASSVKQSFVVFPEGTPEPCAGTGHILYEQWNNIGGNTLSDISFLQTSPTISNQLTSFEGPTDAADNYGSRIRGYICPPASGYYTFWLAGDDASQLWLSTDDNPLHKVKIAEVLSWTNSREWNKFASQKSVQIFLQTGQKYYVEALHKEGGGGDNLAVQWQMPNGVIESPIPGNRLLPFSGSTVTLSNQTISFQAIPTYAFGSAPFDVSASASSGLPVSFRVVSGPATILGTKVTLSGAGTVVIEASQPGNASYNPAPVVTQTFTVTKANQTISFGALGSKVLGDAPFTVSATSTSGLAVGFRIVSGPASVAGNVVTLTGVGTVVIEASQAGNNDYNAATNVNQSFNVTPGSTSSPCAGTGSVLYEQWNNIGGNTLGDISFFQTSPAISNQLTLFEGPTDAADNYGSRIRGYICPPASGYYTFWVAGDDASQLWLSTDDSPLHKVKIAEVLSWTNSREWNKFASQKSVQIFLQTGQKYYVEALHKEGGGGDNLAVQWQMPNGVIESPIPGNRLLPFSGSTVTLSNQTISFQAIPTYAFGSAPFDVSASASSGLPVSFRVVSGPATILGTKVTLSGAGTVVIEASQPGNASYNPAPVVTQTFTVTKANQTISFGALGSKVLGDAPFTISATSTSGLAIGFRIVSGPASVSGNVVTLTGVGTVVIEASQVGNNDYNAATNVNQSFDVSSSTVVKNNQIIGFGPLSPKNVGDAPFAISATATSGLAVSFRVVSGPANLSGNTVTLTGAGSVVIEASQAGNENYFAATPVNQSFTVTPATPPSTCSAAGYIFREKWDNLRNANISTIPLNAQPSNTTQLNIFESWRDMDDFYGLRIRGFICPPVSGNYIFWISGDDIGELYLSSDDNAGNKVKIASFASRTSYREWNKFASQKSVEIYLQAGTKYYIEALHKEQYGEDHLSVAWQLPNGTMEAPIPGSRLSPYAAPVVTSALVITEVSGAPVIEEKEVLSTPVIEGKVASKLSLKVFPNPIKSNATIMVTVPESGTIKLEVLDLQGRSVRTIFGGSIDAGIGRNFRYSSTGLSDGVYIVRLTTKSKVVSQKITVIK